MIDDNEDERAKLASLDIGGRIRYLRDKHLFRQKDLAELVGCNPMTISAWECGTSEPNGRNLAHVAKALKVQPMTLIAKPGPAKPRVPPARGRTTPFASGE